MKKLKTTFVVLIFPLFCIAQNFENPTIKILQGIWKYNPNVPDASENFEAYAINKNNKRLFLTYWKAEKSVTSNVEYWGLQNSDANNLSNINEIGKNGNRYFCVSEKCVNNEAINCTGRNCEIRVLSATNYKLFWHDKPDSYQRINKIPDYVLDKILVDPKISKQYNEFQDVDSNETEVAINPTQSESKPNETHINDLTAEKESSYSEPRKVVKNTKVAPIVKETKAPRSEVLNTDYSTENGKHSTGIINKTKVYIYSKPDILTKMYFIKNDAIEILEERENWVKFKFFNKRTIMGWVKKSEVDLK